MSAAYRHLRCAEASALWVQIYSGLWSVSAMRIWQHTVYKQITVIHGPRKKIVLVIGTEKRLEYSKFVNLFTFVALALPSSGRAQEENLKISQTLTTQDSSLFRNHNYTCSISPLNVSAFRLFARAACRYSTLRMHFATHKHQCVSLYGFSNHL